MKVYIKIGLTLLYLSFLILPTLNLPVKSHPSSRTLFFPDVILVSNYYGCKGGAISKYFMPFYLISRIIHPR